jgi:hypothetical protein
MGAIASHNRPLPSGSKLNLLGRASPWKGLNTMARKKLDNGSSELKQARNELRQATIEMKARQKHNREILAKQGKTIREFRHEISILKKSGIISQRVKAGSQEPTKYMRTKLRKFYDVLVGTTIAVRAPSKVRKAYSEKGVFEERGAFLMIPRDNANMKVKLKGDKLVISQPLTKRKTGPIINKLVMPWGATDILDLANRIEADDDLPEELDGVDQYAFTLFGHSSLIGFPNKSELVEYIKIRYNHLFSGKNGQAAVKNFILITYSGGAGLPPQLQGEKLYSTRRGGRVNQTGRNYNDSWYKNRQRETRAANEKKRRANLSETDKEIYRQKARERAAKSKANRKD